MVVLSSVRYLHSEYEARTAESWELANTFNVAIPNPRKSTTMDAECYSAFLDSFPNQTREYNKYTPAYGAGTPLADEVKMYHFPVDVMSRDTRSRMWPGYSFPRDQQGTPH